MVWRALIAILIFNEILEAIQLASYQTPSKSPFKTFVYSSQLHADRISPRRTNASRKSSHKCHHTGIVIDQVSNKLVLSQ